MMGVSSVVGCRTRSSICGSEMNTLWGCCGGRIDGLAGIGGGGAGVAVMRPLIMVMVRHGKHHSRMERED